MSVDWFLDDVLFFSELVWFLRFFLLILGIEVFFFLFCRVYNNFLFLAFLRVFKLLISCFIIEFYVCVGDWLLALFKVRFVFFIWVCLFGSLENIIFE